MQLPDKQVKLAFTLAKQRYADLGVDVGKALKHLANIPISLHCWQGDDVGGFEIAGLGLAAAWRSREIIRARRGAPTSYGLTSKRPFIDSRQTPLQSHAVYAETTARKWTETSFGPSTLETGLIGQRRMGWAWILIPRFFLIQKPPMVLRWRIPTGALAVLDRARLACRKIGAAIARQSESLHHNVWIPDGYKDTQQTAKDRANGCCLAGCNLEKPLPSRLVL